MRIAMVSFDAGEYGIQLCNALADHADVLLIAFDFIEAEIDNLDARVERFLTPQPRMRAVQRSVPWMVKVRRKLAAWKPDLIHVQHHHFWFNAVLPTLRRYPLVTTVHDPVHHVGDVETAKSPQWWTHFGYRRADAWITHADPLKAVLVDDLGFDADRVAVIPHIAHWSAFPGTDTTEVGKKVLFFGRIWEYKGLEYLIKAQPLINEQVPEAEIVIAGRGENFDRYRRMMVDPGRFVIDNDWIDDAALDRYFAEASIVVLPYIDASQSGVVSIAYAYGKPVVATTVGGLPSVVDDGRTGLLVPPRDADALGKAVVSLLQDRDLRERMGRAAKEKLDREWSPAVVGPQHIEVYERLLARKKRR